VGPRAVTRLRHNKQLIEIRVIVHTTEKHVISTIMSRNNVRVQEAEFSMRSMRQLRDATIELSGEVFSVRSMPRYYKEKKSRVELVVRESTALLANTEVEGSTLFEAFIRRQPVKIQQTEKT
jgi:hypothetical protein